MPKLTIDGKEVEVPKGTRLIQAAKAAGIDVPYYCYHPGLSVAGNCRMCLVEVEKAPKLQIACHLEAADGMVVRTQTEKVLKTRQHVLEFLLLNHPVDCPVCDQAGECWLQDYYMKHGLYDSRLNENKNKKPKAVPLGPHVMLDAERCILCSRCIRFCDEVSKTSELGFIHRGSHTEISAAPGRELDNRYSANTVDICPVGALTDRDFRFKIRVWYLKEGNSVCSGCARGCSIQVHYNLDRPHHGRGDRVKRLKPRYNPRVNQWWMCDEGRYSYKSHDQNRILEPVRRSPEGVREMTWSEAVSELTPRLASAGKSFGVLLSPQMSNEELFFARRLFAEQIKTGDIALLAPNAEGFQDDILIRADKNPNTRGAAELGLKEGGAASLLEKAAQGKLEGLVIFGQDLTVRCESGQQKRAFEKLSWTIFIGSHHHLTSEFAGWVLPAAAHFEREGTFTNFEGVTQKFEKVLEPLGSAKPLLEILALLAQQLGINLPSSEPRALFREMAGCIPFFSGLDYGALDTGGETIRAMAAPTIPALEQYDNIL